MRKSVSKEIFDRITELSAGKINFKEKYFSHVTMTAEEIESTVPTTIDEILSVLPEDSIFISWWNPMRIWDITYYSSNGYQMRNSGELVDGLGELLIWAIEEGLVK